MDEIFAKGDPGAFEENLRDDDVSDGTTYPTEIFCITCKKVTPQNFSGSIPYCMNCGCSSPDDQSAVLGAQELDYQMQQQMAPTYENLSGARTKISETKSSKKHKEKSIKEKAKIQDGIDENERLLKILRLVKREEQDKEEIRKLEREIKILKQKIQKIPLDINYSRLRIYQSRLQTKMEKQKDLNIERFMNIITELSNANDKKFQILSLKDIVLSLWDKTLKGKLQTGRFFDANALACLIIILKMKKVSYNFKKNILEKYDPDELNNTNEVLQKKTWNAQKLINEKIFGKEPCWKNKETLIAEGTEDGNLLPDWLRNGCYRANWTIPFTSNEEKIEQVISNLHDQARFKFPLNQIFETAETILKKSEKKAIIGGQKEKTVSAAIIYLAFLENKVEFSFLELIQEINASESGVKRLSKTINDELKLGLSI